MTINLNRLQSQYAVLTHQLQQNNKNERKARTRTLIQLGGLVQMLGLTSYVGIEEGEDLQIDGNARDKSAILLGILIEKVRGLPAVPNANELESWKQLGIRTLKQHQSKHYR